MSSSHSDSSETGQNTGTDSDNYKSHNRRSLQSSARPVSKQDERRPSKQPLVSPSKQVNAEHAPHEPKVLSLYKKLFSDLPHTPGYWVEFFSLPVNKGESLKVSSEEPDNFVHEPGLSVIHTLVRAAIANLSNDSPADIVINALQVLSIVVSTTLDLYASANGLKRQLASSSQTLKPNSVPRDFSVIAALTGLEHASATFDDLLTRVSAILYSNNRKIVAEATNFVLNTSRKIWGSPIASIFSQKNFFAAFITIIDRKIDDLVAVNAFHCIGILTALNTYGEDNASIYRQRLNDYVDEAVMMKILALTQRELSMSNPDSSGRSRSNASESSDSILTWVSNWFHESRKPSTSGDSTNSTNLELYSSEHIILPLFLFTVHNSVFASQFAASPALIALLETSVLRKQFSISLASTSSLQLSHTWSTLSMMRSLVENEFASLSDPSSQAIIKSYNSKSALDSTRRLPSAGILDFAVLILKSGCNTMKRDNNTTDYRLLEQAAEVIYQVCAQMSITKTIWAYNWPQLWKTIVSTLKTLSLTKTSTLPNDQSSVVESIMSLLLIILVGMGISRDLLEEEDWHAVLFATIYNSEVSRQVSERFPSLAQQSALMAARAMTSQYELTKDKPDFITIQKQGLLAAGSQMVGDKHRPFSISHNTVVKWAIREQIVW